MGEEVESRFCQSELDKLSFADLVTMLDKLHWFHNEFEYKKVDDAIHKRILLIFPDYKLC